VTAHAVPPEIGALLATLAEQEPSLDASAVMHAALAARSATPKQTAPSCDEVAAYGRSVDDVQHTLRMLTSGDWERPAVNGLTVGGLVGHLIGTQRAMAAEVGLSEPISRSDDHIEATRQVIVEGMALTPVEAAAEFAIASAPVTRHLATLDEHGLAAPARFGSLLADIRFLLIGRVFELWTHDNDLRRAAGLERAEPDPERLWMMIRTVMPLVRRVGDDGIRIVLTGAGGGVWPAAGDEVAEVVVDSVRFCRRVANRISVDALDAETRGDRRIAEAMLTALAALALD
jgi:uncharacterized protein (TIGR03083 family)